MFEVNNQSYGFALKGAILLYGNSFEGNACATKHGISIAEDGSPMIDPGAPFTEEDLKNLVQALSPKDRPETIWHDDRVLASGNGKRLWWVPPQTRSLFFRATPGRADSFDGKGICPLPGLIFLLCAGVISIFAIKGNVRPNQATQLFRAPFYNVWSSNEICIGNATCPEREDDLDGWEKMFFLSNFTHTNIAGKNQLTRGISPRIFWKRMIENPSQSFPEKVLVPLKITAGNLLKGS